MELCHKSQFDYLIDIALGTPLESPILKASEGAMINLLGKKDGENPTLSLPPIAKEFPYQVYLYGKRMGRKGRKLGHLNILNPHNDQNFLKCLEMIIYCFKKI